MNNWILKNLRTAIFKVLHFDFGLGNWVMKASMKIWLNLIETSQSPRASKMKETIWAPLKIPNLPQHIKEEEEEKKQINKTQLFKLKMVSIWLIITWPSLVLALNEISQIDMSWTSHMQTKR